MPIDVVLRQFNRLAQYRLGENVLALLLIQLGEQAGRIELNIVEGVDVLRQQPLQTCEQNNYETRSANIVEKYTYRLFQVASRQIRVFSVRHQHLSHLQMRSCFHFKRRLEGEQSLQ